MAKILITCFGSYGDLYPYVAMAKALQQRSHHVAIGSTLIFQSQIESEGIPFIHLRSNLDRYTTPVAVRELLQRIFDSQKGGEYITREMMEKIEETYQDTVNAVEGVDLVISNPLAYATPIVCRQKNTVWLSTVLAPMFFLSVYDPPIMSPAPWLRKIHHISPPLYRGLFKLLKGATKAWVKPLYQLCSRHQLPAPVDNPIFEGQYSRYGTLAMFPDSFAKPQPDWPINTQTTGFPLFSTEISKHVHLEKLEAFLAAGEAPIVFALGSSAVNVAKDFYLISAAIARRLKKRAVLVCGEHEDQVKGIEQGSDIFIINYVAYDKLFPHASVIVHQGGIGTLAQSLSAQRPMLIVPFGFDQFDNAERIENLGIGKSLSRSRYNVETAAPIIKELLTHAQYKASAESIGKDIISQDGTENSCDIVERVLAEQAQGLILEAVN